MLAVERQTKRRIQTSRRPAIYPVEKTLSDFMGAGCLMGEMHESSDAQLLREYAAHANEAAFRELVIRHADVIYSSALRQVISPDLARDVAQSVFTDLARKAQPLAKSMPEKASLLGWLFRSTRYAALNQLRDDQRRQVRERHVMEHFNPATETPPAWEQVGPVLDEAMAGLNADDREALLLRYFKNQDYRVIGQTLGVSDDTAQKRVSRAVERLREFFTKQKITLSTGTLVVLISANAVQAAPVGLAVTISVAALAGTAVTTSTLIAATKTIAMTTLQKTLVTAAVAMLVGAGIYEAKQAAQLHEQNQTLQQQQAQLVEQIRVLNKVLASAANQIAVMRDHNERLNRNSDELLRLRGEVGRLRNDSQELAQLKAGNDKDPTIAEAVQWKARVTALKKHLEQNPGAGIPELQFAGNQDWLDAARREFKTDEDYRRAMSGLRTTVVTRFANDLQAALRKFIDANNKQFPTDIAQLQPYFKVPVDEAILQRYAILPKAQIPNLSMGGDWIISQKAPVDADFDSRVGIGPDGWGSSGPQAWNGPIDSTLKTLEPVMKAYAAANSGQEPSKPSELLPFITTPEQKTAYQKALKILEANERDK